MLRPRSSLLRYAAFGIMMLALGFGGGWISAKLTPVGGDLAALLGPGLGANEATPADLRDDFAIFWEAWNLVENEFYHEEPLDRQRMIRGAIKGMFDSLGDPYTVYQEPNLAALSNEHLQGTIEGIGAYIRISDGRAYIDRPIKNSPALKAGLQQDDEIVAIDGAAITPLIANLDPNEANVKVASLVRGPKGSSVTLTLRRAPDTATFDVAIVRDEVIISSVSGQMLDSGIAYLKITDFKATTTTDFDAAMRELLPQRPTGMVLDLRNNPGGYLTNAQEILGRFYNGVALYEEERTGELREMPTVAGPEDASAFELPMVVLVNGGSASASEIVAGALRDSRPATYLLGEQTYGKGSVQNIHTLSDGGSARVTFAHWLTPHKTIINKLGIVPQFVVPFAAEPGSTVPCVADQRPPEGQSACADSQLAAALTLLVTGEAPPPASAAAK